MTTKTEEFFEKMQEIFPDTREKYIESIKLYGKVLETCFIEDIFMPKILYLLKMNTDTKLLKQIFDYFEEIVCSDDIYLINIFSITVVEILGNDREILRIAQQYMGTKTKMFQVEADKELGRV